MNKLVLISTAFPSSRIELTPEDLPVVFGRSSRADIKISDEQLSRKHSEIVLNEAGEFEIRDLDSTNLTIVNEREVARHVLRAGDAILLGNTLISVAFPAVTEDFNEKTTREFRMQPEDRSTTD